MADIYVARVNAAVICRGRRHRLQRGKTTARAGHPILQECASMFEPLRVTFDTTDGSVEQATARPGEKRDLQPTEESNGLRCDHPGCDVSAKSPAGLAAHKRSHAEQE